MRKSAICACSVACILKDQNLGQVPDGPQKKRARAHHIKKHHFEAQLLERSNRGKNRARPLSQRPHGLVCGRVVGYGIRSTRYRVHGRGVRGAGHGSGSGSGSRWVLVYLLVLVMVQLLATPPVLRVGVRNKEWESG